MFGHDNQNDQPKDQEQTNTDDSTLTLAVDPIKKDVPQNDTPVPSDDGAPVFDTSNISLPASDTTSPVVKPDDDDDEPDEELLTAHASDDLISIKQDALQQLSPLVGHLDQNPEEKFRTTMMMIQASDDQSLVKTAYDAAKQISDDKVRAQALLDIINEINYFTQQAK